MHSAAICPSGTESSPSAQSEVVIPELKSTHSDRMSLGSAFLFETSFSRLSISTFLVLNKI